MSDNKKVFRSLSALVIGAVAGVGVASAPVLAHAEHDAAAQGEHKCSGDKKAEPEHKCSGDKKHEHDKKADAEHKCSGEKKAEGEHKCSGDKK